MKRELKLDFALTANRAETLLEFINTAFRINKLILACVERVGVRGDTYGNNAVFNSVDYFLFVGGHRRTGDETLAGGHVNKENRIIFWVEVLFHNREKLYCVTDAEGTGSL